MIDLQDNISDEGFLKKSFRGLSGGIVFSFAFDFASIV